MYTDTLEKWIKTLEENFNSITKTIKEINKSIEDLNCRNNLSVFKRKNKGEKYYIVKPEFGKICPAEFTENSSLFDSDYYRNFNYFMTSQRAQEVSNKINLLLRLERFYDELCPDYISDWTDSNSAKNYVYYDNIANKYSVESCWNFENIIQVYFPTREIAQQVCDILNKEFKKNEQT